eukprot:s36_g47.t1
MPQKTAASFQNPSCEEVTMAFLRTRLCARDTAPETRVAPIGGERRHEDGKCAPCVFFPHGLCTKGDECRYCHEPHKRVTMLNRTRKLTRDMVKKHVGASIADVDRHEKWNQSACRHAYARRLIWDILSTNSHVAVLLEL